MATSRNPTHGGHRNEVTLVGRLGASSSRILPSGDPVTTFRIVVDREPRDRGPSGRVRVDALECVAFTAALRRRADTWAEGTVVEVTGRLRRRFWRGAGGTSSATEVEVRALRRATMES